MPKHGDSYTIQLKKAHLEWGNHRHTNTRGLVYGEGYIAIPKSVAEEFEIYNSNNPNATTEYDCSSTDGYLNNCTLKASGCTTGGSVYAKQFQGSGNLQLLGDWFNHVGAQEGDNIRISWTSPTQILIEKI